MRKHSPTRSLGTETDLRNGRKVRSELQERFGVYFPAPAALLALARRFCLTAGGATKAYGLPQQPNQPQPLLGKFLFCFCWRFGGAQRPPRKASVSSPRLFSGRSVLLFLRSTGITGIPSCYVLLFLETLVHLASLLRRTGKCSKTYREVRFSVPGSASGRTGKCAIAYREVLFEKRDTQPACAELYREVL
jgi:hypothetical protein